jgi:hypothetical protein
MRIWRMRITCSITKATNTRTHIICNTYYPELSLANKLLLHKALLKPIWTYSIPLWGTACGSNIEILQSFQSKVLRTLVNAPRYIPNSLLHTALQMSTVRDEIMKFSTNYRAKLFIHPNELSSILLDEQVPGRLKRFRPTDLPTRFS